MGTHMNASGHQERHRRVDWWSLACPGRRLGRRPGPRRGDDRPRPVIPLAGGPDASSPRQPARQVMVGQTTWRCWQPHESPARSGRPSPPPRAPEGSPGRGAEAPPAARCALMAGRHSGSQPERPLASRSAPLRARELWASSLRFIRNWQVPPDASGPRYLPDPRISGATRASGAT